MLLFLSFSVFCVSLLFPYRLSFSRRPQEMKRYRSDRRRRRRQRRMIIGTQRQNG